MSHNPPREERVGHTPAGYPPPSYSSSGQSQAANQAPVPLPGTYSPSAQTSTPAYTPDGGAQSSQATAPFGVGSSGSSRQPFGGSGPSVSSPAEDPSSQTQVVPSQRMYGTVYGGMGADSPIDMTMPVTMNAIDNSGSLTGHILSQGWAETPDTGRRNNTKVVVAMFIVLLALVGVSLLFLFTAGSAFTDMLNGVFKK